MAGRPYCKVDIEKKRNKYDNSSIVENFISNYRNFFTLKDASKSLGICTNTLNKIIKEYDLSYIKKYYYDKNCNRPNPHIGETIESFYIKELAPYNHQSHKKYACVCRCGNIENLNLTSIKNKKMCNRCRAIKFQKIKNDNLKLNEQNDLKQYETFEIKLSNLGYKKIQNKKDYFVDKNGSVVHLRKIKGKWEAHQIKPFVSKSGYLYVDLGQKCRRGVHQLVALNFCDNPNKKNIINHIDGNKLNNVSSNLEWCTQKENIKSYYLLTSSSPIKNYRYYLLINPNKEKIGYFKGYKSVEDYIESKKIDISSKSLKIYFKSRGWSLLMYDKEMNLLNGK